MAQMAEDAEKLALARRFIEAIPHSRALSMHLEAIGGGHAVISMPWDERLVGDPRTAYDSYLEQLIANAEAAVEKAVAHFFVADE